MFVGPLHLRRRFDQPGSPGCRQSDQQSTVTCYRHYDGQTSTRQLPDGNASAASMAVTGCCIYGALGMNISAMSTGDDY